MSNVGIQVKIPRGLSTADAVLSDEVISALQNASGSVQTEAKSLAPVASGTLRRSITSTVTPLGGKPTGIVSAAVKYAPFVEYGTKPHTPPLAPINKWAGRKGLNGGAIWAAIRKNGTKAHPFMQPAFDAKRDSVVQRIQKGIQAAIERMKG